MAVATALVPPNGAGSMTTVGVDVYPVPLSVTRMPTVPTLKVSGPATAEAPEPPPPLNVRVGADVYQVPAFVTVRAVTRPEPTTAVAAAAPLENVTVGAVV